MVAIKRKIDTIQNLMTYFDHINEDSMLIIFSKLDLIDVETLFEISPEFENKYNNENSYKKMFIIKYPNLYDNLIKLYKEHNTEVNFTNLYKYLATYKIPKIGSGHLHDEYPDIEEQIDSLCILIKIELYIKYNNIYREIRELVNNDESELNKLILDIYMNLIL
jgi:hypothetical protein